MPSPGTIIIGAIVIGAMIFAAYKSFKQRKSGGCPGCSGCGCGSDSESSCPGSIQPK